MYYFAYGSNMSSSRMKARVPNAKSLGSARLPGYRLAWHKIGRDRSGKCDIVEGNPEDCVYGVLYSIDEAGRKNLDEAEGLGQHYVAKEIDVITISDGNIEKAFTYFAIPINPQLKPFHWYKSHVLEGAREHHLPQRYVRMIETVESIEDIGKT